jgi:transcriptional regulator with XRE-family HTH domain
VTHAGWSAEPARYAFGDLLRTWREDRKISQLSLASRADVSARHLSFVENGRSAPSRSMVLRLAEHLDVPLRDRNQLLMAAGFAPAFRETPLSSPELSMVRAAVRQVLTGHEPYPAVLVDRDWNLVEANAPVGRLFTAGAPADLLASPFNVLRFTLHPRGLAPRIRNLAQWRSHILGRLERQLRTDADGRLISLHRELSEYPAPDAPEPDLDLAAGVVVPMQLEHEGVVLSLFSTVTTFGTPRDITVEELAIESFYPADPETADRLRAIAQD